MTLPQEFVDFFNIVLTYAKEKPSVPQLIGKNQFGYTYERDFVYGQRTGKFIGMLHGWWMAKYGNNPTDEEFTEIVDMIQEHIDEIKRSVSGLKN